MYRKLDADRIVETVRRLRDRVCERFPESGLSRVGEEFLVVSGQEAEQATRLNRPIYAVRVSAGALSLALVATIVGVFHTLRLSPQVDRVSELFQAVDSALNTLILLAGALFFLLTLETRLKRRRALAQIHELRSLAHVIDMHQLTKDPEALLEVGRDTASSPARNLTRFEMSRYLDFCSEMLSLIGKVAALHVQRYDDPVVLSAVDQIEDLTTGLSSKIWQKIMILDRARGGVAGGPADMQHITGTSPQR